MTCYSMVVMYSGVSSTSSSSKCRCRASVDKSGGLRRQNHCSTALAAVGDSSESFESCTDYAVLMHKPITPVSPAWLFPPHMGLV